MMARHFSFLFLSLVIVAVLLVGCSLGGSALRNFHQSNSTSRPLSAKTPLAFSQTQMPSPAISPLATLTPSPSMVLPSATLSPSPSVEHQIRLYSIDAKPVSITEGSIEISKPLAQISLGEKFLFTAGGDRGDGIIRIDLMSKKAEPFLDSFFKGGALGTYRLIWHKPWLVFVDVDLDSKPFHWIVRAYNVETQENRNILEVQDKISWPGPDYSFDGRYLVVSYGAYNAEKKCETSYLWVFDIQSQSKTLVDSHCSEYGPFIWGPVEIHNDILVAEQDLPQNEGSVNYIVFMKRSPDGKWHIYHKETQGYNSMPVMSWPWLVWKAGERYSFGKQNEAYNFVTGETFSLRVPQGGRASDPLICNNWVIWKVVKSSSSRSGIDGVAYLYRLPDGPFVKLVKTTKEGGGFGPFSCTSNGKMAWLYEIGNQSTLVEWGTLPGVRR